MSMASTDELRQKIAAAETKLQDLREQLAKAEAAEAESTARKNGSLTNGQPSGWKWPLKDEEYERYARQLILPGVGVRGQLALRNASVLVIGAGGLGCPAVLYLAGAGIGHIGVIDGDVVESSNLHRQIGHTTDRVGQLKAHSLVAAMKERNPLPQYTAHAEPLTPANASRLVSSYTLILDCTDHPAVRYLISDACVRAGRPLVSAAALRTDGQLSVLNWPVGKGPCYRCVFPRPPPASSQQSCAEGGILGPVVGVMGVLQALEAIRILTADLDSTEPSIPPPPPTLLLVSAAGSGGTLAPPSFRTVRLRGRRADCFACSDDAPLQKLKTLEDVGSSSGDDAWPDYVQFCGGDKPRADLIPLAPEDRISVQEFQKILQDGQSGGPNGQLHRSHWLLDVREKELYDMGSLDGAISVPFSKIQSAMARRKSLPKDQDQPMPDWLPEGIHTDTAPIYLVCRVGNDSQVVARQLQELGLAGEDRKRFVRDILGGIRAWKSEIDRTIPFA